MEVKCPGCHYIHKEGVQESRECSFPDMRYLGAITELAGVHPPLDTNKKADVLYCPACDAFYTREYRWSMVEDQKMIDGFKEKVKLQVKRERDLEARLFIDPLDWDGYI